MSSLSMLSVFNAFIILLTIINYSVSQPRASQYDYLQGLTNKRDGIKYAIDLLTKIDENLAEIELNKKQKRDECTVIGGIPGGDCVENLGDYATMSPRNPGKKRSFQCKLFGRNCGEQLHDSSKTGQNSKRKKRDDNPCLTDEPGGDCETNSMPGEAKGQKWLSPGHRNPG